MEHDDQVAFFEWIEWNLTKIPELDYFFAVPNGGERNKIVGAKLKREGVRKGIPDTNLPLACGEYIGLYIEFKHGKNKLSSDQEKWAKKLRKAGHRVEVCYGWEAAVVITKEYLGIT